MRAVAMARGLPLLLLAALVGCDSFAARYRCQNHAQCVRPAQEGAPQDEVGLCLSTSCAFPAAECPVLVRYDRSASPERAGQCVSPAAQDERFTPVADPDGALVLPPLTALFPGPGGEAAQGRTAAAYLATYDGASRLYRLDPGRANLTLLAAPEPSAPLRLGVSAPAGLFVATTAGLHYSPDGQRFSPRATLALQGLAHDGSYLYALADGQILLGVDDAALLVPIPGPGGSDERVIALIGGAAGEGPVLALTRIKSGAAMGSAVYRREGGAWTRVLMDTGAFDGGYPVPGGAVVLSSATGILTSPGGPVVPPVADRRLLALVFLDPARLDRQWSLWAGERAPLRRDAAASAWAPLPVDPLASDHSGLLVLRGADGAPRLVLASRVSLGGGAGSRLFLGRGAL